MQTKASRTKVTTTYANGRERTTLMFNCWQSSKLRVRFTQPRVFGNLLCRHLNSCHHGQPQSSPSVDRHDHGGANILRRLPHRKRTTTTSTSSSSLDGFQYTSDRRHFFQDVIQIRFDIQPNHQGGNDHGQIQEQETAHGVRDESKLRRRDGCRVIVISVAHCGASSGDVVYGGKTGFWCGGKERILLRCDEKL